MVTVWFQTTLLLILSPLPCSSRFEYPAFNKHQGETSCSDTHTNIPEKQCPNTSPPKDSTAKICDGGNEDDQRRLELSLANQMYMDCTSWCVYDMTDDATTAFMWNVNKQCYDPVTQWLCFDAVDERTTVQKRMKEFCPQPYKPTCEQHSDNILLETDTADQDCIQLHFYDAVNEPDTYNRRLRCRCPNEKEGVVTRRAMTAIHCTEPRWSDANLRIELALINGMYKNCDNWCLFDIYDPDTRYWSWNPWHECWDDTGKEESVCDRVVAQYGEELQFAQKRSNSFCGPLEPPKMNWSWHTGSSGTNCNQVCREQLGFEAVCVARAMMGVTNDADDEFIRAAFKEAGVDCDSISVGDIGATGTPAHKDSHCVTTAGTDEAGLAYCQRSIVGGYNRLCACSTPSKYQLTSQ